MAAEKRVLLARPHAFIVNQMRPFLLDAGYVAVGARDLDHLRTELASTFKGAIISTAVTSTVEADAAAVFRLVRERQPRLPVVFAGMADAATMRVTAERAVKDLVASPVFAVPDDYRPGADRQASFLILRKDDLLDAAAVERSARALRSHFG
jgi:DNA-binding NtrC family response regulator